MSVIVLSAIGAFGAIVLFLASKKFEVREDPRIASIQDILPAANCGGCGFPGCSGFAAACVKSPTLEKLNCPVGGQAVMDQISSLLGLEAVKTDATVAVVRCNGSCDKRPEINIYDGASTCGIAASLYGGETGCSYGCLGLGDCAAVCLFHALYIDRESKLPVIDEKKCTSCGACVEACPKLLIELRKIGPKSRRIYIACRNKDKGGVARKACNVACIGCGKCQKVCPFEAVSVENNLAYIDDKKCRLCRKCVAECPTSSIVELNFPVRKNKTEDETAIAAN